MGEKIFYDEHEKWIKENTEGVRNEKLTEMFNKHFNMNLTVGQIKKFKNFHHISSGLKSCNLPVGSERESKGYILVKIAEPNVWIEKHRLIYESMYGNIPTGCKVIFADKNKRNFNPNNLVLVSDSEALIMNTQKLIYEETELTRSGVLIAKIIDQTNKLKRKVEN